MVKKKEIQVTVVEYADFIAMFDGSYPSKFVFRDAQGDYNFVHTSKRVIAEQYVKDNYNSMYSVREV